MNNQKSRFMTYTRQLLLHALHRPLFTVTAVLFNASCALYFFFGTGFFSGAGTSDLRMFFASIPYISIIILPLVCFKKEDSFYAEMIPLSPREKVWAEFSSRFLQFIIMSVLLPVIPVCVGFFGDTDPGQTAAGFLLLVFYAASAVSLCTLCSAVCNPLVSFIVSALFIAVGDFSQNVPVLRYMSFAYHFDAASRGIADSRDILFYFCSALLFMHCAVLADEHARGKKYTKKQRLYEGAVFGIIILSFLNSMRYYFRTDLTRDRRYTLSSYTRTLQTKLSAPLKITYYESPAVERVYPRTSAVYDYLEIYADGSSDISIARKNPDKDNLSQYLEHSGIRSQQIQTGGANRVEYLNVYSAVVLEYLGKAQVLPFVVSPDQLEYDLDRCVSVLTGGKIIKTALLSGNGLDVEKYYSYVRPWFESQLISCSVLQQGSDAFASSVAQTSSDTMIIVLGSSVLTSKTADALADFRERGGKTIYAVSPYVADIEGDWSLSRQTDTSVTDMLSSWGFSFTSSIAADISCARITLSSSTDAQGVQTDTVHSQTMNYPLWISIMPQTNAPRGMTLYWLTPVVMDGENVHELLSTSKSSWNIEEDSGSPQKLFETNPFIVNKMKIPEQRMKQTAAASDGNTTVIGDQYFASSIMMEYSGGESGDYRNLDFLTYLILTMEGEHGLADLQSRAVIDISLYKAADAQSFRAFMIRTLAALFGFIPLLYISFAAALAVERKKKNKEAEKRLNYEKK